VSLWSAWVTVFGLTVTAEGVEDPEQRDSLPITGSENGKGFVLSAPLSLAQSSGNSYSAPAFAAAEPTVRQT
jgi:EAL domain-containing protein (putative c-di-GMP-specific phosphodiesterase class I)